MSVLKVKLLNNDAKMPKQAHENDVAYDVWATSDGVPCFEKDLINGLEYLSYLEFSTGLSVEPPEGYHIELAPRSSLSDYSLSLCNSFGVIDPGYRGELKFRYRPQFLLTKDNKMIIGKMYKKGDKIGQMIIRKTEHLKLEQVDILSETTRGEKGFGSSDAKPTTEKVQ